MYSYDTLVEAMNDLKKRGFTTDFNIAFDQIKCADTGICLLPAQFEITEVYRFEGMTDPDDSSVLFAVAAKDESMKGVLVSAYGVYSDAVSNEMMQKLKVNIQ